MEGVETGVLAGEHDFCCLTVAGFEKIVLGGAVWEGTCDFGGAGGTHTDAAG